MGEEHRAPENWSLHSAEGGRKFYWNDKPERDPDRQVVWEDTFWNLPEGWLFCYTDDGNIFFTYEGTSTWRHPQDPVAPTNESRGNGTLQQATHDNASHGQDTLQQATYDNALHGQPALQQATPYNEPFCQKAVQQATYDNASHLAPNTHAPENLAPNTRAPEHLAPNTHAPENLAPNTRAPEHLAPNTHAPVYLAPNTRAPEHLSSNTRAPELAPPTHDSDQHIHCAESHVAPAHVDLPNSDEGRYNADAPMEELPNGWALRRLDDKVYYENASIKRTQWGRPPPYC